MFEPYGFGQYGPITQIVHLKIPADRDLKDATSYHGRLWTSALDLIEQSDGFRRLYWGRSLEKPENLQLHISKSPLRSKPKGVGRSPRGHHRRYNPGIPNAHRIKLNADNDAPQSVKVSSTTNPSKAPALNLNSRLFSNP